MIVKSSVTTESQPAVFTNVSIAVVLLVVYVIPSIHVNASQAVCVSVAELERLIVKSRVTTESQPALFTKVS